MTSSDRIHHWEHIYQTKSQKDVSWYQAQPLVSLQMIAQSNMPYDAKIIDIGGGDSLFADHLLELGYTDITVLDISITALEKAQQRLGEKARLVKWIESDVTDFEPKEQYDIWHDRAVFHFLITDNDIDIYVKTLNEAVKEKGYLAIGTFSDSGQKKCSGIDVRQYSEDTLAGVFNDTFKMERCFRTDHQTPFNTIQNFVFGSFSKK